MPDHCLPLYLFLLANLVGPKGPEMPPSVVIVDLVGRKHELALISQSRQRSLMATSSTLASLRLRVVEERKNRKPISAYYSGTKKIRADEACNLLSRMTS
jgi:hypothetical protein